MKKSENERIVTPENKIKKENDYILSFAKRKNPIVIQPEIAEILGLCEAIMFNQIKFFVELEYNNNIHDGQKWVTKTHQEWNREIKFYSISSIKRALENLVDRGLILVRNVNKNFHNRTLSYSINYQISNSEAPLAQNELMSSCVGFSASGEQLIHKSPRGSTLAQNELMHQVKMSQSHEVKMTQCNYVEDLKDITTTEVILTPQDVVVSYMIDFGYEKKCAITDLEEFGEARCREVIEHVKKLPEKKDSPVGYVRYLLKTKASLSSKKGPSSPYNDATPIIQHFDSFKKSDNMPIGVKLLAKKLRGAKNGLDN